MPKPVPVDRSTSPRSDVDRLLLARIRERLGLVEDYATWSARVRRELIEREVTR
jgi:hypothetical protein